MLSGQPTVEMDRPEEVSWLANNFALQSSTQHFFMRAFGRLLQKIGLVLLPVAMVLQLLPGERGKPLISLQHMLMMMVAGICCFWIGRIVEGYSRS
jgi:hypothetical protein